MIWDNYYICHYLLKPMVSCRSLNSCPSHLIPCSTRTCRFMIGGRSSPLGKFFNFCFKYISSQQPYLWIWKSSMPVKLKVFPWLLLLIGYTKNTCWKGDALMLAQTSHALVAHLLLGKPLSISSLNTPSTFCVHQGFIFSGLRILLGLLSLFRLLRIVCGLLSVFCGLRIVHGLLSMNKLHAVEIVI